MSFPFFLSLENPIESIDFLWKLVQEIYVEEKDSCISFQVMKLLEEESIEWTEGNAGTILIPLDKVNPKTLSFTKK